MLNEELSNRVKTSRPKVASGSLVLIRLGCNVFSFKLYAYVRLADFFVEWHLLNHFLIVFLSKFMVVLKPWQVKKNQI